MEFQPSLERAVGARYLACQAAEDNFQDEARRSEQGTYASGTTHPGPACGGLIKSVFDELGAQYAATIAVAYWQRLNELRWKNGWEGLPLSTVVSGIEWSVRGLSAVDVGHIQQAAIDRGYRSDW